MTLRVMHDIAIHDEGGICDASHTSVRAPLYDSALSINTGTHRHTERATDAETKHLSCLCLVSDS